MSENSLVSWKKKTSLYRDENDGDPLGIKNPGLTDSLQPVQFITRDSVNAKAMKALKLTSW